jgi:Luciferase
MRHGQQDLWDVFVIAMQSIAPVAEGRSRYGDKPALSIAGREIAHREAAGVIDLRITRTGWSQAREGYATDPAVRRDPSRRDWIELHLRFAADLERISGLLAIALAANA